MVGRVDAHIGAYEHIIAYLHAAAGLKRAVVVDEQVSELHAAVAVVAVQWGMNDQAIHVSSERFNLRGSNRPRRRGKPLLRFRSRSSGRDSLRVFRDRIVR